MKTREAESIVSLTICLIVAICFIQIIDSNPPPSKVVNLKLTGGNSSSVAPKLNSTRIKVDKIPIFVFVAPLTTPKTCKEGEKLTEDNTCRKLA